MSKASHITRAECDEFVIIYLMYTLFHSRNKGDTVG